MSSYIFGGDTGIPTPQELKRRRTVAEALAERAGDTSPTTLAGGLGRVAQGLMARYARNKADKDEKAGIASASDGFSKVMQKLMGGGTAASSMQGSTAAPTGAPALTGDLAQTEAYIRKAAAARGIDPDIAVKVARSEGLAPGVYQSNIVKNGQREPSYGPFQLYTGGGLGNEFMKKTGLDPRDPSTVNQQIDFALDAAKNGGWSPWYGARKVGVGNWDGIGGQMQPAGGQAPAQEPPPRTPINIVDDQGILAQQQSVAPSQEMPPQQQGATAVPQGYEQAAMEVDALPMEEIMQLMGNPYLSEGQAQILNMVIKNKMDTGEWMNLGGGKVFNTKTQEVRDFAQPEPVKPNMEIIQDKSTGEILSIDKNDPNATPRVIRQGGLPSEPPRVQTIKQPDGSEVAVQWNAQTRAWEPMQAPQGGNPVKTIPKLTEQQSKDLVYYQRGEAAVKNLEGLESALTSYGDAALDNVPLIRNSLTSVEYQKANQAGREFLAAVLRKDTGAAITNQEMEIYGRMYLPQPGEGPEILAQKKAARRVALDAIRSGLGAASMALPDQGQQPPPQPMPEQGAAPRRLKFNPVTGELE